MNIETQLYILYASSMDDAIDPLAEDFHQELAEALPVDEVKNKFLLSDRSIYFSYLNDELAKDSAEKKSIGRPDLMVNLEDPKQVEKIDHKIAQRLFAAGYSYKQMIHIMTNSIRAYGERDGNRLSDKERTTMGIVKTIEAVNPIVSMPTIATAKPIYQISLTESPSGIYSSMLRHVLQNDPAIHLNDADEKVVQLLAENGFDDKSIAKCMKNSFELRRYSDEEIDKFVARAQSPKSQKNLRDIVSDDSISQMEGSEIYQTVNTTLQTLLYSEKMWDLKTYWEDAMKTLQEGITFMQQAEQGARLMRLWALGISKTVKEFNIEKDAAIQEIFEKASKIANAPVKEDDSKTWETYYNMSVEMDIITNMTLEKIAGDIIKNPLLRVPEITTAKPLSTLDVSKAVAEEKAKGRGNALPKILYYGAVKDAVLKHPGIGIYEADKYAYEELSSKKISPADIKKALSLSSRLEYLPAGKKKADVETLVKYLEGKTVAKTEGAR